MKILKSYFNGAVTITEDAGSVALNFDEALGGGAMKGVISGKGSIVVGAMAAVDAGEEDLNKMIPAALLPIAEVIEKAANAALEKVLP